MREANDAPQEKASTSLSTRCDRAAVAGAHLVADVAAPARFRRGLALALRPARLRVRHLGGEVRQQQQSEAWHPGAPCAVRSSEAEAAAERPENVSTVAGVTTAVRTHSASPPHGPLATTSEPEELWRSEAVNAVKQWRNQFGLARVLGFSTRACRLLCTKAVKPHQSAVPALAVAVYTPSGSFSRWDLRNTPLRLCAPRRRCACAVCTLYRLQQTAVHV